MKELYRSLVKQNQRKVIGLGKNFPNKNSPLGSAKPSVPIIFSKAWSSIVFNPSEIKIHLDNKIFFETELGIVIGKKCICVTQEDAMNYVGGYFLALDLTLNNLA